MTLLEFILGWNLKTLCHISWTIYFCKSYSRFGAGGHLFQVMFSFWWWWLITDPSIVLALVMVITDSKSCSGSGSGDHWFQVLFWLWLWWLLIPSLVLALALVIINSKSCSGSRDGDYWFQVMFWLSWWWSLIPSHVLALVMVIIDSKSFSGSRDGDQWFQVMFWLSWWWSLIPLIAKDQWLTNEMSSCLWPKVVEIGECQLVKPSWIIVRTVVSVWGHKTMTLTVFSPLSTVPHITHLTKQCLLQISCL